MISKKFMSVVMKKLKSDYNIICHSIRLNENSQKGFQTYSLSCSGNKEIFSLDMKVSLCPVDSPSHLYTFEVYSMADGINFIPQLKSRTDFSSIRNAINDVRLDFSYLDENYEFILNHKSFTLLSGQYFVGSSYFEIKSIQNIVAAKSSLVIRNFETERYLHCSSINISDNKIFVSPWTSDNHHPTFNQYDLIEDGGLDTFKANLAKTVFLFFNDTEDDYMQLDYTDMKRYLLVYKMIAI